MFRFGYFLIFIVIVSVLASCASTESLTAVPSPVSTETITIPTLNLDIPVLPLGTMQCNLNSARETTVSALAQQRAEERWFGAENPRVQVVIYYDLQCPYCAALHPILRQLADEYPDDLQVIYRAFPAFMVHDKALLAAQALEAAFSQDPAVFLPLLDAFYNEQDLWSVMDEADFSVWLLNNVLALGLEREAFESAMADPDIRDQLVQQLDVDLQAGVTYTPYLLINGEAYPNLPRNIQSIRAIIDLELLEQRQFLECPPPLLEDNTAYIAVLHTEKGEITIQLMPETAPQAVNNFIFLSQQGWYDDIPFYRVIPSSYALSGDPSGTGLGSPGYTFSTEIDPNTRFDRPGVVAMNSSGAPDTNGANFFITYQALPGLDGVYTVFGQVIAGMDVLQQLTPRDPISDTLYIEADRLLSVTIQTP